MDLKVFLAEHPELYQVMQSEILMRIISHLETAKTLPVLSRLTGLSLSDLSEALDVLERIAVVKRVLLNPPTYRLTRKGLEFLTLYRKERGKYQL